VIVLALDVGEKRIGVATSDDLELLASPRGVIRRQSTVQALDAVARSVGEAGAGLVVVGLPVSFDGQLHAQARRIQAFADKLRRRLAVPVIFADETLSSVRAEEQLRAAGVRPERIRMRLDAAAAAVILQEYLDQRRSAPPAGAAISLPFQTTPEISAESASKDAPADVSTSDPEADGGMEETPLS
jgi:putative Holliday junction resolvase